MIEQLKLAMSDTSARPTEAILGIGYSLLISADQTGGAYELIKFVAPPGSGPPLHLHHREDEGFFILEGVLDVYVGDQVMRAERGGYVHLPRGVAHRFFNPSDQPTSFLCWVMPGNLAAFFDSFKRPWPVADEQPPPPTDEDIGKLMEAAKRHQMDILAP